LNLNIFPLKTQKSLKISDLVASFMEITLPLRPECLVRLKYFSTKDAKDAKILWLGGFGAGATAPARLWYSESLDLSRS